MLSNLALDQDVVVEVEKDTLGGGSRVLESGVYDFTIKAAYLDAAKSKAVSVNLILENADGQKLNVTEYITSGEAKGCKPYYVKDGKKYPLPGYSKMNGLCELVAKKTIDKCDAEDKILKLWDFEAKAETNQSKKVITDLTGGLIKVGVKKVIEDKRAKGDDGQYHPTGETRELNEADKFFNEDGKTLKEVADGKDAVFITEWEKAHKGKTKDKSTKSPVQSGAPTLGGAAPTAELKFD